MTNANKNLLVLFNTRLLDEKAIEQETEYLAVILKLTESPGQFCTAHELVDRNRISSRAKKIWRESKHFRLRPFRFLINKN